MTEAGEAESRTRDGADGDGRAPDARPVSAWRRHHPLVFAIALLNIAFALSYTLLVPPYRGPDERLHLDMIRHYKANPGFPSPGEQVELNTITGAIKRDGKPEALPKAGLAQPPFFAADAPPRGDRPTLEELGRMKRGFGNQMSQHPPLYYAFVGSVTTALTSFTPADFWSWDREIYLYRILSVLIVAPLALLASFAVLAIGLSRAAGAVAAATTLLIPQKTFISAVTNNDVMMILLAALAVACALRYACNGPPRYALYAAGAGAGIALTKSTGATVAAWVGLVIAMEAIARLRRGNRAEAESTMIRSFVILGIGSLWYISNLVRYNDPQPSSTKHPRSREAVPISFWTFLPHWLDRISKTFWAMTARRLGIHLPWWVSHALSILVILAIVFALVFARRLWRITIPLVLLIAVQAGLLLNSNWKANRRHVPGSVEWAALQGRYLYALIVPVAVFVAIAGWRLLGERGQRALLGIAVGMTLLGCVMHIGLGLDMLQTWWQGRGVPWGDHLHSLLRWSPLPVGLSLFVLLLPIALALLTAIASVRWVRLEPHGPGSDSIDFPPRPATFSARRVATPTDA